MKVSGNYPSLIRGVSQQVPHKRALGQHADQVNMLADPVNGLSRRPGSQLIKEQWLPTLTPAAFAAYSADTESWRTLEGSYNNNDYVVMYRTAPRVAGAAALPLLVTYNKTSGVFITLTRPVSDATLDLLETGGISACVMIGRYLYMAGNTIPVMGYANNVWADTGNMSKSVIWIRAGAYGRTITLKITLIDNTLITYSVTTPVATYPGVLTTADIPLDANYTKNVNDRVNAYTAAVTAWIASSTFAMQPSNQATYAATALSALGIAATAVGSHIAMTNVKSVQVNDGGDGTLLRGVADEVESVDRLSPLHFAGKIVKIRTRNSEDAFYMKAIPKIEGTTGMTEVTWIECAGVEQGISQALCLATLDPPGSTVYMAGSPTALSAILPGNHPTFAVSTAGDSDSNPIPYSTTGKITYLGSFQDRMIVGVGGSLVCSQVGDYLNFWRTTVLSVPADDAFQVKAQGPDDDILRSSVLYDQSLIIFGDKRQYMISGKTALSPSNAAMPVMSTYANAALCPPHTAGGLVFYSKRSETFSSVHQIQPGQGLQNSPESFTVSSQIDTYLPGNVIEFASNASPCNLFLRCSGSRNSVHVFSYIDSPQGRNLDAWSRWDFDPELGVIIGMSSSDVGLLVYFLRSVGGAVFLACDLCTLTPSKSPRPYLDSQRTIALVAASSTAVRLYTTGPWYAVYGAAAGTKEWLGCPLAEVATMQATYPGVSGIMVGTQYSAKVTTTNPYMRDKNGDAILSGRLTVSNTRVSTKNSGGFTVALAHGGMVDELVYTGRVVGSPLTIGSETISTTDYLIPIGKETRDYTLTMTSRTWLPFTITAIEWTGQFFNRTQRF